MEKNSMKMWSFLSKFFGSISIMTSSFLLSAAFRSSHSSVKQTPGSESNLSVLCFFRRCLFLVFFRFSMKTSAFAVTLEPSNISGVILLLPWLYSSLPRFTVILVLNCYFYQICQSFFLRSSMLRLGSALPDFRTCASSSF